MTHHERGITEKKLRCRQIQIHCSKYCFTNDVGREWSKLPPSVMKCTIINSFKHKLDSHHLQQVSMTLFTASCSTMLHMS